MKTEQRIKGSDNPSRHTSQFVTTIEALRITKMFVVLRKESLELLALLEVD
jgi:hypothetical protein